MKADYKTFFQWHLKKHEQMFGKIKKRLLAIENKIEELERAHEQRLVWLENKPKYNIGDKFGEWTIINVHPVSIIRCEFGASKYFSRSSIWYELWNCKTSKRISETQDSNFFNDNSNSL